MRGSHVALGLFVLSCSSSTLGPSGAGTGGSRGNAGCTKDTDCKGDRICSAGACVSPADVDASSPANGSAARTGISTFDAGIVAVGSGGKGGQGARASGGTESAGGALIFGTGGSGAGSGAGGAPAVCAGQAFGADPVPVDMYLMFDQSSSMGDPLPGSNPPTTWWQAAQMAVTNFVNDQRAGGARSGQPAMSVGIQFFPLGGIAPQSCMADYTTPEVEIGLLPGNAATVAKAIQKHQPTSFTPTAAALSGAIAHMKAWAPSHPGHAPVVVLVTDGFPTECDPQDITDISVMAKTAFESEPKVRTFVVGFNLGPGGQNLGEIAKAGGTNAPFLINGGDIGSQFVDAMLSISNTPLQCSFDLPVPPNGQKLDVSQVAVTFTPNATMVEAQIPKLNGLGDCDLNMNNGWFYDSPSSPSQILVCPGTCARFTDGIVRTYLGCATRVGIGR